MLLGWLGARSQSEQLNSASRRLEAAITSALSCARNHTPDLGGDNTTEGFGEAVLSALKAR
jgi:isocitrate/isopropylmalate dehydrogenase